MICLAQCAPQHGRPARLSFLEGFWLRFTNAGKKRRPTVALTDIQLVIEGDYPGSSRWCRGTLFSAFISVCRVFVSCGLRFACTVPRRAHQLASCMLGVIAEAGAFPTTAAYCEATVLEGHLKCPVPPVPLDTSGV